MKKFRYLNIILIVIGILSLSFIYLLKFELSAQTTDHHEFQTIVTVGNSCPTISGSVVESVATVSTATSPTTIGQLVTWTTTATDPNGENYYLIICSGKTGTAVNGGAPTCGANRTYQISSSTASGSSATASYTTLATDPWLNQWYAYVCDSNATNAKCCLVSADPGSAANETPFYVNHAPSFTGVSNNSPRNPGQSVTWTTTASDPDGGSTVKLLVCKTQAISGGACTGGDWCTSTAVSSNPTCSYLIPTPTEDKIYNAYVYVVDQFNTPASGGTQGTASNYTVNNVAPVVSAVILNDVNPPGSAIDLAESSTKPVPITVTVADNNGCGEGEIASVKAYVYRSGIGYTGCDTAGESNGNNCYPEITCSVGTCSGATATYSCTANLQYYADPTTHNFCNIGGTTIQYFSQNWLATVKATDNNSQAHSANSSGVEVNVLAAFSINPSDISYGSLSVGDKNDPLDKTVVLTATGNSPFNVNLSGTNMCVGTSPCIVVGKQKFALAASTAYASGTTLTTSPSASGLGVPQINNGASTTKTTWWGIEIPAGTIAGSYGGTNDIDSVFGGITTACP